MKAIKKEGSADKQSNQAAMMDPESPSSRSASAAATSSSNTNSNHQPHNLPINVLGLSLVCLTPMALGFLYGFDIGATSFVLKIILLSDRSRNNVVWWSEFTSLQQGLFVSALSLGALIGSHLMILSLFSKNMGRRMELRVAASLYIVGTLINVASGTLLQSNDAGLYALFFGRILFGIGVGFVMHG